MASSALSSSGLVESLCQRWRRQGLIAVGWVLYRLVFTNTKVGIRIGFALSGMWLSKVPPLIPFLIVVFIGGLLSWHCASFKAVS